MIRLNLKKKNSNLSFELLVLVGGAIGAGYWVDARYAPQMAYPLFTLIGMGVGILLGATLVYVRIKK